MQSNSKMSWFMLVLGFCYEGISMIFSTNRHTAVCILSTVFSKIAKCSGNIFSLQFTGLVFLNHFV